MNESKEDVCFCLYDSIINLDSRCMFENELPIRSLGYVAKLIEYIETEEGQHEEDELELTIDGIYCRLALLTNEQMIIDDKPFFRVFRIVYFNRVMDLNKIRDKLDITIWSNGSSDFNGAVYMAYWRGILIGMEDCPPEMSDIRDYVRRNQYEHRDLKYLDLWGIDACYHRDSIL